MGETNTAVQDLTSGKPDSTPAVKEGSTSPAPETITRAEAQKLVSDALADAGRKHKAELEPIIKERDTFKSQAEQAQKAADLATSNLNETQENIASLEEDLKTLSETNPDSAEIVKIKKELRAEKSKLNQEVQKEKDALADLRKTLNSEREQFAGVVSEAQALRLAVDTFEVAEDFEGGDSERLKVLCEDRIEATGKPMSREDVEKLAGKLWSKKTAQPKKVEPALLNDSGVTNGGAEETPQRVRQLFIGNKINSIDYEKRMKALGVKP
jgi:chromosome segregation ATPase